MGIHRKLYRIVSVVVLVLVLNQQRCSSYGGRASSGSEKALFIFGDSLFDAGNNQYYLPNEFVHANHHPYGMTYATATGRNSDGLLLPDFIAYYAGLPLIPPFLDPTANGTYGYNFASSGAGVLYHAQAINLDLQLRLFQNATQSYNETLGAEETTKMLQNAVYIFSIGGDDYVGYGMDYPNATVAERQAYVDLIVTKLIDGFKYIYARGGRKFAIQDVGALGCFPSVKLNVHLVEGCYEAVSGLAVMHNAALRTALATMKDSQDFIDIKYAVFDYYTQIRNRILRARDYGFAIGDIACCGTGGYLNGEHCGDSPYFLCTNPREVVLFDPSHPSQAVNIQTSRLMWSGDQNYVAPYNVQQLFEDDEEALQKASLSWEDGHFWW